MSAHSNNSRFALARVSYAGCAPFVALVLDDRALGLHALAAGHESALIGVECINRLLESWPSNWPVLSELAARFRSSSAALWQRISMPLSALSIAAPVAPRQVFCTIGNYRSQVVEAIIDGGAGAATEGMNPAQRADYANALVNQRQRSGEPYVAVKLPTAVAGPSQSLQLPHHTERPDWEVELAVVIGREARHVSRADALEYIAGYTVANDITVRELVLRADPAGMGTDWLQCKSAPGFLPLGPLFLPADAVGSVAELQLHLTLNGQVMQSERAGDMIFDVARQIEYISRHAVLLPGDVICTGSPAGFGSHYQRFLRPGDSVEATIHGKGERPGDSFGVQRTAVYMEE